jgi:hypothetical protein
MYVRKRLKRKKLPNYSKKSFGYFEWGYFWRDIFFKIKLNECFVVATIGAIDFSHYFYNSFYPFKGIYSRIFFVKIKRDATVLALKSDSLTIALKKNDAYIQSIQKYSMS